MIIYMYMYGIHSSLGGQWGTGFPGRIHFSLGNNVWGIRYLRGYHIPSDKVLFFCFFFFQKLPNIALQLFKLIYIHLCRLDLLFFHSKVLHKVHT